MAYNDGCPGVMISCPICYTPPSPSVCRCGRLSVGYIASSSIPCWKFVPHLSVPGAYLERLGDVLSHRRPMGRASTKVPWDSAGAFVDDIIQLAIALSVLDS